VQEQEIAVMNQHKNETARRVQAPVALADKNTRKARDEKARTVPALYRPRFTVSPPESDAGFVPGYN
jgi:hypothetical protein